MKVTIDITDAMVGELVVNALTDCFNSQAFFLRSDNKEDRKYAQKMSKALKTVIAHYVP